MGDRTGPLRAGAGCDSSGTLVGPEGVMIFMCWNCFFRMCLAMLIRVVRLHAFFLALNGVRI